MTLLFSCFSQKQVVRMGKFFLRRVSNFLVIKIGGEPKHGGVTPSICGVSSAVERYPSKLDVVGSIPILRFYKDSLTFGGLTPPFF